MQPVSDPSRVLSRGAFVAPRAPRPVESILLVSCLAGGDPFFSLPAARDLVARLRLANPQATFRSRDLRAARASSEILIAELTQADHVVLVAGPLDRGLPGPLEGWLDLVTLPGVTFRQGADRLEGALVGRRASLVLAYEGVYRGGVANGLAFERSFLRAALSLIGLDVAESVVVEGSCLTRR